MNFVRWIFYNPETGDVFYSGTQQGDFKKIPVEQVACYMGYPDAAYMEWTSPDPDIEAAFSSEDADGNPRMVQVSVDLSDIPRLVFTYSPITSSSLANETADMKAALNLLGIAP